MIPDLREKGSLIGEGRDGAVYLYDNKAIKMFKSCYRFDIDVIVRKCNAMEKHGVSPRIHETFNGNGETYISMDYLDASEWRTARKAIHNSKSRRTVKKIYDLIFKSMDTMHRALSGLAHGDMNPGNIMIPKKIQRKSTAMIIDPDDRIIRNQAYDYGTMLYHLRGFTRGDAKLAESFLRVIKKRMIFASTKDLCILKYAHHVIEQMIDHTKVAGVNKTQERFREDISLSFY